MKKKTGKLDIEQWVLDYLNSDYDGKLKKILKDKEFIEEWFSGKTETKDIAPAGTGNAS